MALTLTPDDRLARARGDLRAGLPVAVERGDATAPTTSGVTSLVTAAEGLTDARLAEVRALGPTVLALTRRRAETLKARAYDGDLARIALPADATAAWVRALADPSGDLSTPMKGPLPTLRDGDPDAARMALRLAKAARLLPAALVTALPPGSGVPADLTRLDAGRTDAALTAPPRIARIVTGRVPLAVEQASRVHVFREAAGGEEHYAVEIGRPDRDAAVLVRLHSACFTGDVIGSLKCDCGPQLHAALDAMRGGGVLLYLNEEGRGIGLANKLRAYALQDQGFDTVEANHRVGFEDDERDFRLGAAILSAIGVGRVRLLTNNPAKVAMLQASGIEVAERVPLAVGRGPLNEAYLATKAAKSGHLL